MATKKPWDDKWIIEKEMGGGGQGTTFLVNKIKNDTKGVLKVLKNQKSDQARRRMFVEVSNLTALHSAGCKVPKILDSNIEKFEQKGVKLYFVMEHISGKSLADTVQEKNGLSLKKSCSLVFDLCKTEKKALDENVIHRDIKPENIIVRSYSKNDVVIVDFGLSFNQDEPKNLTRNSETIDNEFLSLPERRVRGGDRRDPRSDFTGICAILYYCIIAEPPVDLVDANGILPHRRPGRSLKEKLGDDLRTSQLEAFFDRGFSTTIDTRFQSIDELITRLKDALHPSAKTVIEKPEDFAKQSAKLLLQRDRKTQIKKYNEIALEVLTVLRRYFSVYKRTINPYYISPSGFDPSFGHYEDTENINSELGIQVGIELYPNKITIAFDIRAKGTQCGLFRNLFKLKPPSFKHWIPLGEWEPIMWRGVTS